MPASIWSGLYDGRSIGVSPGLFQNNADWMLHNTDMIERLLTLLPA